MHEFLGNTAALQDINATLREQLGDGIHVSWNVDWVNRVALLSGDERTVEIQRGIDNIIQCERDVLEGRTKPLPGLNPD